MPYGTILCYVIAYFVGVQQTPGKHNATNWQRMLESTPIPVDLEASRDVPRSRAEVAVIGEPLSSIARPLYCACRIFLPTVACGWCLVFGFRLTPSSRACLARWLLRCYISRGVRVHVHIGVVSRCATCRSVLALPARSFDVVWYRILLYSRIRYHAISYHIAWSLYHDVRL